MPVILCILTSTGPAAGPGALMTLRSDATASDVLQTCMWRAEMIEEVKAGARLNWQSHDQQCKDRIRAMDKKDQPR